MDTKKEYKVHTSRCSKPFKATECGWVEQSDRDGTDIEYCRCFCHRQEERDKNSVALKQEFEATFGEIK